MSDSRTAGDRGYTKTNVTTTPAPRHRVGPCTCRAQGYHGRVKHRAAAYWPTRTLLVVGTITTAIVFALPLAMPVSMPAMSGMEPTLLGFTTREVVAALAAGVAVFGLVWMVRIFRGPRDEPPIWSYRDH